MPFKSRQLLSQSPAKYHVFKDGTKYFCENRRTGKLPITDTDAYAVLQALFTDYLAHGDRVFIENGEYSLSDEPNLLKQRCIIEGEGWKTRLIPATGKYALKIGNGTLDCGNNMIRDLQIEPSSLGDGSGILADKASDIIIDHVQAKNCYTGFELKDSARTRLHLVEPYVFTNAGILYTTTGIIADQYLNNIYVESNQPAAIGIKAEESVNGIRITDALIAGALKAGLAYGIDIVGSYSGVWLNNVIIDQLYGTCIRLKNGVSHGCAGIQGVNVWAQSCGGHGMEMEGSVDHKIKDVSFTNSLFMGNDKTGVKMQNAEWVSFENCKMMNNGQDNLVGDVNMTNLLLLDVIATTEFSNCWFGWMDGFTLPSNRQMPVLVRAENGQVTIVKFTNSKIRDPSANAVSRIQYYQHTDASAVYLYGYECMSNNFAVAPDNTLFAQDLTGDPATVAEEAANHIGKAFGW